MKIFAGKVEAADRTAQALVKMHCTTPEELAEAAHSLVVLGVPAKTVFLRAAREVRRMDLDLLCSTLGLMGGEDAIGVLCDIVADAKVEDQQRKYAAMALDRHSDTRIGPALHTAVKQVRDEDALGGVVRTLARSRYEPAAPDLLAALQRMKNDYYGVYVAEALGALRYREAVPEIRRLLERLRKDPEDRLGLQPLVELQLLRITADWGKPGKDARVLVVPPANAVVGQEMKFRIHVENIGTGPLRACDPSGSRLPSGLLVDGKPRQEEPGLVAAGSFRVYSFYPGEVHTITYDLSQDITTPGPHTVQYVAGDAESPVATFTVRAAEP